MTESATSRDLELIHLHTVEESGLDLQSVFRIMRTLGHHLAALDLTEQELETTLIVLARLGQARTRELAEFVQRSRVQIMMATE
jgi:hypothetical protein